MKRLLLVMAGVIAAASFHPALPARLARLQAQASPNVIINPNTYQDLRWRSIGPHRGGRSTAAVGVRTQPNVFYMASRTVARESTSCRSLALATASVP